MKSENSTAAATSALDRLLSSLELSRGDGECDVSFVGDDPIVASKHRPAAASAAALAAEAVGIAAIWRMRGGGRQSITVDLRRAAVPGLRTSSHIVQNGHWLQHSRPPEETRNFFATRDGRRIYVLRASAYPANLLGVLNLLRCRNSSEDLAEAIGQWDGRELEEALAERKLVGALARTRAEWLAHPQGRWLSDQSPVQIERIGDSDPEPFGPAPRPLSGVRVLDMAHVLAGPVSARTLAEQGAEVLRLSAPLAPDDFRIALDTGFGKRSAFIDLNRNDGVDRVKALSSEADVFVQSFRPGSLDKRELSPRDIALIRPGIIYLSVSAYGTGGPWAKRGGFDPVGQAVSGLSIAEGSADRPLTAPTSTLNDYLAAYLAAAGVVAALVRRARVGGSYHVNVSLTRCSMWLQELGQLPPDQWPDRLQDAAQIPDPRDIDLMTTETPFGTLKHPKPIVEFSQTKARWSCGPAPLGSATPDWSVG